MVPEVRNAHTNPVNELNEGDDYSDEAADEDKGDKSVKQVNCERWDAIYFDVSNRGQCRARTEKRNKGQ